MAQELLGVFFKVDSDDCSSAQGISFWVWLDLIWSCGLWGPNPLSIIIVGFRDDNNFRSSQESGIKSDTKLSDKVNVTGLEGLKEIGGAWLGNGTKILNKFLFSHTNTSIGDLKILFLLIDFDSDLKIFGIT